MRRSGVWSIGVLLAVTAAASSGAAAGSIDQTIKAPPSEIPVLQAQGPRVDVRVNRELYAGAISLPAAEDPETINTGTGASEQTVCLESGAEQLCVRMMPGDVKPVAISFDGTTSHFVINYRRPAAHFPAAYRSRWSGSIRAEDPPAYELVNVALALTDHARHNRRLIATSPYADEVRQRFADFSEHPFVKALNEKMAADPGSYHLLKMNGAAFRFDTDGELEPSPIYDRIGWGDNVLLPLLREMRDFARTSRFLDFYHGHASLYDRQAQELTGPLDADGMVAWLYAQFPDVQHYDDVRILFSPLVGSNQSLAVFDDDGYRELQPHVNYPYPRAGNADLSTAARRLWRGTILFTELNHGFINETAGAFSAEIGPALADRSSWVRAGSAADTYRGAMQVFDEMVNWGLISVWAQDSLPGEDAARIASLVAQEMEGRGFTRFAAFQERLLALAARRSTRAPIASIYPALVTSLGDIGEGDAGKTTQS